jgi:hypothetical protein
VKTAFVLALMAFKVAVSVVVLGWEAVTRRRPKLAPREDLIRSVRSASDCA